MLVIFESFNTALPIDLGNRFCENSLRDRVLSFFLTVSYLIHRTRHVQSLQMTRSLSTHSLPDTYGKSSQQKISRDALPRAVWSMALKTGTLIIGCEKGSVEVKVN